MGAVMMVLPLVAVVALLAIMNLAIYLIGWLIETRMIAAFMNCEECDKDIGTARYCLWCGHDNG